jgi:hypothetical protein
MATSNGSTDRAERRPPAQGAEQLGDVLAEAQVQGFTANFSSELSPKGTGLIRCDACAQANSAVAFRRIWTRRLEGVSDPADMLHVSALRCPNCGTGGVFVSSFGPTASAEEVAVLQNLRTPEEAAEPSHTDLD